jgi:hypothetical protein
VLELESVLERAVASAREPVLEVDKALLDEGLPLGHYRLVSKLGEGVNPKVDAAARCALEVSQAFPQRAVVLSIDFESGDAAIDRAMHLLSAEHLSLQVMGAPGAPHVRVDEDTARYLGREYQLRIELGHTYLEGRSQS